MDDEIKKLIEDYVRQIESKEADFVFLQKEIDAIIFNTEQKVKTVQAALDVKFDMNDIHEEEYLKLFREAKERILQETNTELSALTQEIEVISNTREEKAKADADEVSDLRKKLGLGD